MQQSNIAVVGDGTGGVTEPLKDRFMVFHDGSRAWLDTVTTHELVHVFQFRILVSGFWKSARVLKTLVYPLWMMEGMAEFFSWGSDDTAGTVILRDAATSDGLIPIWKSEHFSHLKPHQIRLAYESGAAILEFLETEYGRGLVEKMIKLFESRFESSAVLHELIGADIFTLDRKWREYERDRWNRRIWRESLLEPEMYGPRLTGAGDDIPEFNTSPVFTPDGRSMAYLTTRYGYPPSLVLQDLETGRVKKLYSHGTEIENLHLGHFTNNSRALSISKDGRRLAFTGTKNHEDSIYLYDLAEGKLRRVRIPGFTHAVHPAFSPDGKKIAFSGMKDAMTDIYLLDLESSAVTRLTSDPHDDQTPAFTPDGTSVVYTSEVEVPGSGMLYQRRLTRVRLSDLSVETLARVPGAARDPVVSDDGRRVLFSLEGGGHYEVHELDLDSGKVLRLTRSVGAAYTPAYAPGGTIAFSGLRRGSVHIHRGPRERFLSEEVGGALPGPGRTVELSTAAPRLTVEAEARSPFSTDLFLPAFFYSSDGGLFWTSYWQGADLLGDHQAQALIAYQSGAGFLDYQTGYGFNRWRTKLSAGARGRLRNDIFDDSSGLTQDESAHLQFVGAAYPLDRFHRIEASVASATENTIFDGTTDRTRRETRSGSVALVRDTVQGRYLVATEGSRIGAGYLAAPRVAGGNTAFQSVFAQGAKYFPTGGLSTLVTRAIAINDWGPDSRRFELGGFSGVRGYGRSTVADGGPRVLLATVDWRLPLFGNLDYYMWYIFPDFYFKAITLSLFTDMGYAWRTRGELEGAHVEDIRHSFGIGLRLHTFILQLFPLVLHFDYAQRTSSNGGIFYVYLGPLF